MIQLYHIETSYPFQEVSWYKKNKIIETDKGKKEIGIWTDENQLNWHIDWRERLFEKTGVLTDRVIRTNNGEKALATDNGWITVHDVIDSLLQVSNYPFEMGRFLGSYATVETNPLQTLTEIKSSIDWDRLNVIPGSSLSSNKLFEKIRMEAIHRGRKANELLKNCNSELVDNMVVKVGSLKQAKNVQGQLFWENKERELENSIDMLCSCIKEWVLDYGEEQLDTLLNGVNETCSLESDNGKLLLARFVYPKEFESFLEEFDEERNGEEVDKKLDHLSRQWDLSKTIVDHIVHWLVDKKEKVS